MTITTITHTPTDLDPLIEQARALAQARNHLATAVNALNEGIEALKAEHMGTLRLRVEAAANEWALLEALIQQSPQLFAKPRTVSVHGIKFGLEKGAGKIEITDAERTVRLIKAKFPDQAGVLIKTTEEPVKKALGNLTAAQLKQISVNSIDAGDRVVIRPEDGAVDKLVKALITAAVDGDSATE